jgi:hypothetical protein
MSIAEFIPKEQLGHIQFEKSDVLNDAESQKTRMLELHRAMRLGNLYHGKVKINFKTRSGLLQQVETTIWAVTENYILLKGGAYIPVVAILSLEF